MIEMILKFLNIKNGLKGRLMGVMKGHSTVSFWLDRVSPTLSRFNNYVGAWIFALILWRL